MGYWNYRLFKRYNGEIVIIECYYENDKPSAYTGQVQPYGETPEELKQDLEWMLKAFDKPILTKEDFPSGS